MRIRHLGRALEGAALVLCLLCRPALAPAAEPQPGTRDPDFISGLGPNDLAQDLVVQPDRKIVVLGYLDVNGGVGRWNVARLNPDGGRDASFQVGSGLSGPSLVTGEFTYGHRVELGADGRVVVAGVFTQINGIARTNVARLNENGSVDLAFNPPALARPGFEFSSIYTTAIQQDGKVLIGGTFNLVNGLPRNYLARLNVDGSLDSSFDAVLDENHVEQVGAVVGIALQSDGRILIRGSGIGTVHGAAASSLIRLNPDGSLDSAPPLATDLTAAVKISRKSFGLPSDYLGVDAENRILTAIVDDDFDVPRLVRKTVDGQVDEGFNFIPGAGPRGSVYALAFQADGKILAAGDGGLQRLFSGEATPISPVILRQPPSFAVGEYSNAFFSVSGHAFPKPTYQWRFNGVDLPGETGSSLAVIDVQLTKDGSYYVVISNALGSISSRSARLSVIPFIPPMSPSTLPGAPDLSFSPQTLFTGCGFCLEQQVQRGLLVQPDDKVLVGGDGLRRLHPNGRLDGLFNPGLRDPTSSILPVVSDMALLDDGRILICGNFTKIHGVIRNGIARLRPDGSLDEAFDAGDRFRAGAIQALAWQTNGQVLVAGRFSSVDGATRGGIARLDASGRLDPGFTPGIATPATVNSVMLQSNGEVLIAGSFTAIGGVPRRGFARLLANGSLDTTFDPTLGGGGSQLPRLLAVQPDGKIWITGQFGGPTNLVRLWPNGSVDLQIARLSLNFQSPLSLALQPDGKVIVGGRRSVLARLNVDGSVDATFAPPRLDLFGSPVGAQFIALQSDGRIVLAGDFTSAVTSGGNSVVPGFARLFNDRVFFPTTIVRGSVRHRVGHETSFRITAFPGSKIVTEAATSLESPAWAPLQTNTIATVPITIVDTNAALFPRRFYRLGASTQ